MSDDFGNRMKDYEQAEAGRRLMPLLPICVRIDGRSFSRWTRGLDRPYDRVLSRAMIDTTIHLVEQARPKMGYTQSDEISLVFAGRSTTSDTFFSGKVQKLVSVLASLATAKFNDIVKQTMPAHVESAGIAAFDCRVWSVPNEVEATNSVLWREQDAGKNSVSMAARAHYSHNELHGKSSAEMQEMLLQKGVNWDGYPAFFKRGTFVRRRTVRKPLDAATLARIPEKLRASVPQVVDRTEVVELEMPPFSDVTNRVDVIFRGADPITLGQLSTIGLQRE